MAKKAAAPDFGDILDDAAGNDDQGTQELEQPGKPDKPEAKRAGRKKARATKPGRAGKVLIGGHFPEEVAIQLGIIAAEERTTRQALLGEALDLLFAKKAKKKLAV